MIVDIANKSNYFYGSHVRRQCISLGYVLKGLGTEGIDITCQEGATWSEDTVLDCIRKFYMSCRCFLIPPSSC